MYVANPDDPLYVSLTRLNCANLKQSARFQIMLYSSS